MLGELPPFEPDEPPCLPPSDLLPLDFPLADLLPSDLSALLDDWVAAFFVPADFV